MNADVSSTCPCLARLAKAVVLGTLALILVGGMVTTHQAGMAFLTWPLSDGSLNPAGWTSEKPKLLEHGHRLLAGLVAILTVLLAVGCVRSKSINPFIRRLSIAAVVLVFMQALLGGLRVLVEAHSSPEAAVAYRVFHGVVAQTFLVVVVILAARLSPVASGLMQRAPLDAADKIRRLALVTIGLYFAQLICAAILRHQPGGSAGLIISTWPKAQGDGSWLPMQWSGLMLASFLHTRVIPILLIGHVIGLAIRVAKSAASEPRLRQLGWLLLGLLLLQAVLGVQVIWMPKPTARAHVINTHVINGALTLATAVLLAVRAGLLSVKNREVAAV